MPLLTKLVGDHRHRRSNHHRRRTALSARHRRLHHQPRRPLHLHRRERPGALADGSNTSLEPDPGPRHQHRARPRPHRRRRVLKATEIDGGVGFPKAVQVLQLTRTITNAGTAHTTPKSSTPSPRSRPSPRPAQPHRRARAAPALGRIEDRAALGPRCRPTQKIIRGADQQRTPGHGHAAQHRDRPAPTPRPRRRTPPQSDATPATITARELLMS